MPFSATLLWGATGLEGTTLACRSSLLEVIAFIERLGARDVKMSLELNLGVLRLVESVFAFNSLRARLRESSLSGARSLFAAVRSGAAVGSRASVSSAAMRSGSSPSSRTVRSGAPSVATTAETEAAARPESLVGSV